LDGNGGPECATYLTPIQAIIETICVFVYTSIFEIYYPWIKSVCNYKPNLELRERFGRKLLLAGLCLIWGIEIGFKLSTRQLIFILNPCHMLTLIQLILLISPPRRWMHILFRIQTYFCCGATIAILFPVLNTRHLPFEVASYYIHHGLLLITPLYLQRLGGNIICIILRSIELLRFKEIINKKGIYNMEPLSNWHWSVLSLGLMKLYHFLILQPISYATHVNLNSMMCPAVSDPFRGPYYRMAANFHQIFFVVLHGKILCFIGKQFFVPKVDANNNKND